MPLDLLLVRHGQSEGNIALERAKSGDDSLLTEEFRDRSASEYRLTSRGRAEAARAGEWVRSWAGDHAPDGFDRLYCSPFVRTRETAALLGLPNAGWRLESLLRERDFGLWEGRSKAETAELFPESSKQKTDHKFLWRPECGESTPDLDLRAREVLATLARELTGRQVLCVTHEDMMWAFRYRLEKMTIEEWIEHEDDESSGIPNCGILHFTRTTDSGEVAEKFARVRLVDPRVPDRAEWRPIERPRFTDNDLLSQVNAYPPLWGGHHN